MVTINETKCIGCGKCTKDCIAQNITIKDSKASVIRDCFLCGHCVAICPTGAVTIPEYDMDDVETYQKDSFTLNPEHVLHSIKFRRSIRDYKNLPVEQDKLHQVLQAGRYSATAKNNQDCCFVFVQKELATLKEKVWNYIEEVTSVPRKELASELKPYALFNLRHKKDPADDYLFRNAPVVVFITSDWPLDAGLAAQNMELMSASLGLGMLYDGFLSRICDINEDLKKWLGIQGKSIKACMLLGYPNVTYARTAPRREAQVIFK